MRSFVTELEQYSGRTFGFREELTLLVDSAVTSGRLEALRDAAFHAKFISKTHEVMKRIGPKGEGYEKLATELQSSISKAAARLRELLASAPADQQSAVESRFLRLDPSSLDEFFGLMSELAWVKNWEVDGKPLPGSRTAEPVTHVTPTVFRPSEVSHAFRSGILGILLLLAFILLDPPVSVLGFVFAGLAVVQFGIVLSYVYRVRRHLSDQKEDRS